MTTTWTRETTAAEVAEELKDVISGKNVLITGVTVGGLGFEAARVISLHANLVIVAGSNAERLQKTIDAIHEDAPNAQLRKVIIDLASLASVRAAAAEINAYNEGIHVVITNAATNIGDYHKTAEGYEMQFGVDHLAHFLLVKSIMPRILAARSEGFSPRIVAVASSAHRLSGVRFDDPFFSNGETYEKGLGYGQAKTANILWAAELSRRLREQGINDVLTFSLHPGSIPTIGYNAVKREDKHELGIRRPEDAKRSRPLKTIPQGAAPHVIAAFDPRLNDQSGSYIFDDGQVHNELIAPHASDPEAARKLWDLSEALVKDFEP